MKRMFFRRYRQRKRLSVQSYPGHRAGNSIPAAGAFDVVEHIEDNLHFLKTIYSKLRPNGLF